MKRLLQRYFSEDGIRRQIDYFGSNSFMFWFLGLGTLTLILCCL